MNMVAFLFTSGNILSAMFLCWMYNREDMKEIHYEGPPAEKESEEWEKKKKVLGKLATVRTFRADVQELIQEKKVTKTSIALAEAGRREARGETRFPSESDDTHLGRIIFILVLVLAFGLGVGGYALFNTHLSSLLGKQSSTSTPTATTEDLRVNLANSPREQALADISIAFGKTYLPTGERRTIIFLTTDEQQGEHRVTPIEFFSALQEIPAPEALTISLDSTLTYQVYSSSTLSGIIVLRSRAYANTFAALLEWEPRMANQFIPILNPLYSKKRIKELRNRPFKDGQILGVAVRELSDLDGISVLAYGFIDKKTLIIAGTTDALRAMIIEKQGIK